MAWDPYEQKPDGASGGGGFETPEINVPKNLFVYILLALVGLMAVLAVRSAIYTVEAQERAVVLRLGALNSVEGPGFHFKLPFGIDRAQVFETERVHKEEFGFRTLKAGTRTEYSKQRFDDEKLMLTGDLNIGDVEWIVQYQISDPTDYWFNLDEPEQAVRDLAESVVRQVVGDRAVDQVLTVGRSAIEDQARREMQQILTEYQSGIKIVALQLQNVTPPEPVQPSFNDVNRAEQDREKMENDALSQLNREIPNAKGEAQRTIAQAEGYRTDRINRARGNTARFLAVLTEYRRAPEVTRQRIYLESIAEVMPHVNDITILDGKSGDRILPHLDLGRGGAR